MTISSYLTRVSGLINGAMFKLAVLATGLLVLPTIIEIVARLFSSSLYGVTEMTEFLLAVMIFASLGYINDQHAHIRVEIFRSMFSKSTREGLELATTLGSLIFFIVLTFDLFRLAQSKLMAGETMLMLSLPVGWMQMFGVAGLACMSLSLLAQTLTLIRRRLEKRHGQPLLFSISLVCLFVSLPLLLHYFLRGMDDFMWLGGMGMLFLLSLLLIGLPIGILMSAVGYMGMIIIYPSLASANTMLAMNTYNAASNQFYSVIPMFILMGELALLSGISSELFRAASLWFGRLPGGLAIATISGCAGFSAVSGDSMATAVTMTSVALPEMEKHHYEPGLACATLAAGGSLGILIPPSTGFIFYSLVTEESVGKLFAAGLLPGILMTLLFILLILIFAKIHPELAPPAPAAPLNERLHSLAGILPMLGLIMLILGGIMSGVCSPNEGGAVGVAGTLIYSVIRKRLTWKQLRAALISTTMITARLMLILVGVGLLSPFLAATALPMGMAEFLSSLQAHPMVIFACIVIFYIILGCIMNVVPMILLTLPALYPAVKAMEFDPLWFGVIVVIMMEMGQITPPVGLNVYAISAAAPNVPMGNIFRRIVPFFLAMLISVIILALFPQLATWLPGVIF